MMLGIFDILEKIGYWTQEHMYIVMLILVFVVLTICFIISYFKQRNEKSILEEERLKSDIDAPRNGKQFVQGQKIKRQELSINEKEEE